MGHSTYKQVIVMAKYLNMRKGKMVAQGSHASMAAVVPRVTPEDIARGYTIVPLNEHNTDWLAHKFAKICVSAQSETELLAIYEKAKDAGLPCSLIQDSGLTEFNNVPTYTAVAVGPSASENIDPITGHLPLL